MNKDIENALGEAGYAVSSEPPVQQQEQQQPQAQEQPQAASEAPVKEVTGEQEAPQQQEAKADDIDSRIFSRLSEKLGKDFDSYDSISEALSYKPVEIDERVSAINKFVLETGRSPEDWYRYQSLDPSEMDEMALIRLQMSSEHSNLEPSDIDLLISNKYKLDEDFHSEDEVKLAKLQLKMDAENARKHVGELRDSYKSPDVGVNQDNTPISKEWISEMSENTNMFGRLEFDLPGKNETFNFGIDEGYRKQLIQRNSNLENYFDDYVSDNGSWDFDKLNAHRALVDNIDSITASIYNQGLSDGRMGVVQSAANVDSSRPSVGDGQSGSGISQDQLLQAFGGGDGVTFNP